MISSLHLPSIALSLFAGVGFSAVIPAIDPTFAPRSDAVFCASLGDSTAPEPSSNSLSGFTGDTNYDQLALNAPVPTGYTVAMSNANCAFSSSRYMLYVQLDSYSPETCAELCNNHEGCDSFNIYIQRDPSQIPGPACPNPAAIAVTKCALYSEPEQVADCTNFGQHIGPLDAEGEAFKVAIRGSNAYNKLSVKQVIATVIATVTVTTTETVHHHDRRARTLYVDPAAVDYDSTTTVRVPKVANDYDGPTCNAPTSTVTVTFPVYIEHRPLVASTSITTTTTITTATSYDLPRTATPGILTVTSYVDDYSGGGVTVTKYGETVTAYSDRPPVTISINDLWVPGNKATIAPEPTQSFTPPHAQYVTMYEYYKDNEYDINDYDIVTDWTTFFDEDKRDIATLDASSLANSVATRLFACLTKISVPTASISGTIPRMTVTCEPATKTLMGREVTPTFEPAVKASMIANRLFECLTKLSLPTGSVTGSMHRMNVFCEPATETLMARQYTTIVGPGVQPTPYDYESDYNALDLFPHTPSSPAAAVVTITRTEGAPGAEYTPSPYDYESDDNQLDLFEHTAAGPAAAIVTVTMTEGAPSAEYTPENVDAPENGDAPLVTITLDENYVYTGPTDVPMETITLV